MTKVEALTVLLRMLYRIMPKSYIHKQLLCNLYDPDLCLTKNNRDLLIYILKTQVLEFDPQLADSLSYYIYRNKLNKSYWLPLAKILNEKLSNYLVLRGNYRTTSDIFLRLPEDPWNLLVMLNKKGNNMILNLLIIPGTIVAIMLFLVMIGTFVESIKQLREKEYVPSAVQLLISMILLSALIAGAAVINEEFKVIGKTDINNEFQKSKVERYELHK